MIGLGSCVSPLAFLLYLGDIPSIPRWVLIVCGSGAILVFCSFIVFAIKAWEQIRPTQDQLREKELKAKLKVKGSSVKHIPHPMVIQNSAAPAFRQAGLGLHMPLMETHPSKFPGGQEGEMIDLTKFLRHLLGDGRLIVRETHSETLIISERDLSRFPASVVLERVPEADWAWKARVEMIGSEDLAAHAEVSAVGDKYANEWLFSFTPFVGVILAVECPEVPLLVSSLLVAMVFVLGAVCLPGASRLVCILFGRTPAGWSKSS